VLKAVPDRSLWNLGGIRVGWGPPDRGRDANPAAALTSSHVSVRALVVCSVRDLLEAGMAMPYYLDAHRKR